MTVHGRIRDPAGDEAAAYFHLSDKLLLNIEKHALKILMAGMKDGEIL